MDGSKLDKGRILFCDLVQLYGSRTMIVDLSARFRSSFHWHWTPRLIAPCVEGFSFLECASQDALHEMAAEPSKRPIVSIGSFDGFTSRVTISVP
jgi:hypothetical protein